MGDTISKLFHHDVGNEKKTGKHFVNAVQPAKVYCRPTSSRQEPFVIYRRGSMYYDEDGELAHEFYVESEAKGGRRTVLEKVPVWKLVPQGMVAHEVPRLNSSLSTVMMELRKVTGQIP